MFHDLHYRFVYCQRPICIDKSVYVQQNEQRLLKISLLMSTEKTSVFFTMV